MKTHQLIVGIIIILFVALLILVKTAAIQS